jgi:hypothetical protein
MAEEYLSPTQRLLRAGASAPPAVADEDDEGPLNPKDYSALTVARNRSIAPSLEIVFASGLYEAPSYRLYVNLSAGTTHGSAFSITFSSVIYDIQGENLEPVFRAVASHRAVTIREFREGYHAAPAKGMPIITKIRKPAPEDAKTQVPRPGRK